MSRLLQPYYFLSFFLLLAVCRSAAQTNDSLRVLDEVSVTGYALELPNQSTLNIRKLSVDSANRFGAFNLTDLIGKEPGLSILSTGPSISKPVIRGLYGNRILVLMNGLRFDNQQWQEEHGLGISTIGIRNVELIKGPFGILFGSEAIGGVINIIEEQQPEDHALHADLRTTFNTNTRGGEMEVGAKKAKEHSWWRIRAGAGNNADYTDGNNQRVLNSRFDNYCIKAGYGFTKNNWNSSNNFASSFSRFGFIFNDVYTFIRPDERWSRRLSQNPAHLVLLNLLSSENTIQGRKGNKLQINAGIQSNKRMENEGSGAISLNMHLLTLQYLLRYEHRLNDRHKIVLSHLNSFESNINYGARKIVPDARMQEANLSVFMASKLSEKLSWENGTGVGIKYIKTLLTPSINGQNKEMQPFQKTAPYYNFFTGLNINTSRHWQWKLNAATGVRIANLAELSSDGLHEGVFTYEIGNPGLKNEQLFAVNFVGNYCSEYLDVFVSPFVNYFLNYIYLAPTTEQWFGFPVYRYQQQQAKQYGTEAGFTVKPGKRIQLQCVYSGMNSKTDQGQYTSFIPPQKIKVTLKHAIHRGTNTLIDWFGSWEYNDAQRHTAPLERSTPSYALWHAGVHTGFTRNKSRWDVSLSCRNLFNLAYYDHLSRFKNFGLLNMGRNLTFSIQYTF